MHYRSPPPSLLQTNPPLVGVVGVDVPISELEAATVSESLGSTGYHFLVNNNGFVAMHPGVRSQHFYLQVWGRGRDMLPGVVCKTCCNALQRVLACFSVL